MKHILTFFAAIVTGFILFVIVPNTLAAQAERDVRQAFEPTVEIAPATTAPFKSFGTIKEK